MTSYPKQKSRGVAAGCEDGSSSDDDFMFGDDLDFEKKKGFFNAGPETSSNRPWNSVSAPWLTNKDDKNISSEEKTSKARTAQNLGDVSIQAEDFRVAVEKGEESFVKDALKSGFPVDAKLRSGWTGLMYASSSGQLSIIKLLIGSGANVNFQKDMFTALMALCTSKSRDGNNLIECAKCLINANARINCHDRHLMTPLMYAAQSGQPDLVQLLIDSNADLNSQDMRGWTALAFAASSGHAHVVKVLLCSKEVNSQLCAYDGQSPTDLAYASGHQALSNILDNSSSEAIDQLRGLQSSRLSNRQVSKQNSRYVAYGDLELFLCGIELGHLVGTFREHQLSFQDFLKINDEELIQIGINELGIRKKILEAIRNVHTSEWDLSSLTLDRASKISTLEAAAIIANVTKHLSCIQSSVSYLQSYINENKESIRKDDAKLQKILVQQCKDGQDIAVQLESKIRNLQNFVAQAFPKAYEKPCNLIGSNESSKKSSIGKRMFYSISLVTLLGLATTFGFKALKYQVSR